MSETMLDVKNLRASLPTPRGQLQAVRDLACSSALAYRWPLSA